MITAMPSGQVFGETLYSLIIGACGRFNSGIQHRIECGHRRGGAAHCLANGIRQRLKKEIGYVLRVFARLQRHDDEARDKEISRCLLDRLGSIGNVERYKS